MKTSIIIRFQSRIWHHYDEAPAAQAYLRYPHRHLTEVEVEIEVFHDDRDIEFHAFQQFCEKHYPEGDVGTMSCEMLARNLLGVIEKEYGNHRSLRVDVFEDGEVGARITKEAGD